MAQLAASSRLDMPAAKPEPWDEVEYRQLCQLFLEPCRLRRTTRTRSGRAVTVSEPLCCLEYYHASLYSAIQGVRAQAQAGGAAAQAELVAVLRRVRDYWALGAARGAPPPWAHALCGRGVSSLAATSDGALSLTAGDDLVVLERPVDLTVPEPETVDLDAKHTVQELAAAHLLQAAASGGARVVWPSGGAEQDTAVASLHMDCTVHSGCAAAVQTQVVFATAATRGQGGQGAPVAAPGAGQGCLEHGWGARKLRRPVSAAALRPGGLLLGWGVRKLRTVLEPLGKQTSGVLAAPSASPAVQPDRAPDTADQLRVLESAVPAPAPESSCRGVPASASSAAAAAARSCGSIRPAPPTRRRRKRKAGSPDVAAGGASTPAAPPAALTLKLCGACGERKPTTAFRRSRSQPDGHLPVCKSCRAGRQCMSGACVTEKLCVRCGETKPAADFWPSRLKLDGLNAYCRLCKKESDNMRGRRIAQELAGLRVCTPGPIVERKRCVGCKVVRLARYFHRSAWKRDGLHSYCKRCRRADGPAPAQGARKLRLAASGRCSKRSTVTVAYKVCQRCKLELPAVSFNTNHRSKDGLRRKCRGCAAGSAQARPPVQPSHKVCWECGEEQPAADFDADARTIDGLQTRCQSCAAVKRAARVASSFASQHSPAAGELGATIGPGLVRAPGSDPEPPAQLSCGDRGGGGQDLSQAGRAPQPRRGLRYTAEQRVGALERLRAARAAAAARQLASSAASCQQLDADPPAAVGP